MNAVKRVAVVGLAFRFPGTTTEQYWPDLLAGRHLVGELDPGRWSLDAYLHPDPKHPGTTYTKAAGSIGDVAGFDADFFGISPREAALMDPQQRVLLELAWEAMENAGMQPAALRGSDCGVYLGIASTDYAWRMGEDLDVVDASTATGNAPSIAANRLSYVYDLRGPSVALDTACSSSMVAFHQACRAIVAGECTQALAGGINLHLHPYGFIGFSKATMLSRTGRCRVFDAAADGYVRSEGGGLFLLKDYAQARADGDPIWAVVAATAVNTDGRKAGLTIPSAAAQAALMRQTCARAGITPDDMDYLEAHGTGTPVGDPIEARAIGAALGQPRGAGRALPIGSVKSNLGHLETASGVAGLVKALYALRYRMVPATIGVETLNPNIQAEDWNIEVVMANRPLPASGRVVIGVNSFGFGGANAHAVLMSAPEEVDAHAPVAPTRDLAQDDTAAACLPVLVTAKTGAAVRDYAARLAEVFETCTAQTFYDVAYQLARCRQWHAECAAVFAANGRDASEKLRALAQNNTPVPLRVHQSQAHGALLVYSGNGAQWLGMGARLLADPVFAQALADVDALFQPLAGWSLAETLAQASPHGDHAVDPYAHTEIAQPALFAVQVGITRMLARRGVVPGAVLGHSVGEVAAAWTSGALSLPDAVQVIYHRSRLQGLTRGQGQMSAIGLSGAATQTLIEDLGLSAQLHLAGLNSATAATVAGDSAALDVLDAYCAAQRHFCVRLKLDYAFHSPAMDPIEVDLKQALAGIAPQTGTIPFYSTVTGALLDGSALDGDYWWRNVRAPVQFVAAVSAALTAGHGVLLEVSPHAVLRHYLQDMLKASDHVDTGLVVTTAKRNDDAPQRIDDAAGRVMARGARINWDAWFTHPGRRVTLPAYAWQRERHWHPTSPESIGRLTRVLAHPLLGYAQRDDGQAFSWQQQIDTQAQPFLADHVVGDAVVFPGAGYVELVLAAAWQWQQDSRGADRPVIEVENLAIHAPLLLAAAPSRIVCTTLDPRDGRVRILVKEQGAVADWVQHVSARVLPEPGAALLSLPTLTLPERAPDFRADEHQALTGAAGLNYGSAFRAIAHGWVETDDSVLAVLSPHDTVAQAEPTLLLHPALLDCAFQLVIHVLKRDPTLRPGVAFVPVSLGRLALAVGQGPVRYARMRLRRRAPRSLMAEFDLYDAHGDHIVTARDVRFRSVRLNQGKNKRLSFFQMLATPRALPGTVAPGSVDVAQLRAQLHTAGGQSEAASSRFGAEVEPLLEILCDRYAAEALAAVSRSCPASGLMAHVLHRAVVAGDAQLHGAGWQLIARAATPPGTHEIDPPGAADIWNTLLRDYPDDFAVIHALGRVGLHLPALLQGQRAADTVIPSDTTYASITRMVYGDAFIQWLIKTVLAALVTAQHRVPAGQRLAVLEVGNAVPLLARACVTALDGNRADYHYVTPKVEVAEAVRQQFAEKQWRASVYTLADADNTEFDLAVVQGGFDTLSAARQAMAYVSARLKPAGVLLWLGHAPAPWLDFLFGAQPLWWEDDPIPSGARQASAQQAPPYWQKGLQDQGLVCEDVLSLGGSPGSGAYVLLATRPAVNAAPAPATAPRHIVLLSDAGGAAQALAHALQARLTQVGHRCHVLSDVDAEHIPDALHAVRGEGIDDLVCLDGWGDGAPGSAALTQAQVRRCALAAALVRTCGQGEVCAANKPVTLWLFTRGVAPQTEAMDTLPSFNDAALWGYGRTLIQEAASSHCRVRLVDLPVDAAFNPGVLAALARELDQLDAEDEVFLDATGARSAPRLRQVQRPAPRTTGKIQNGEHHARLGFESAGQLRALRWEAFTPPELADDAVQVRVHATGLNFRDVMYTLGLLSDEAVENGFVGASLGLEFAGVVMRTGKNVSDYQTGDAVLGFGPASFATDTVTSVETLARIPAGWSFEAAATLPSTFFTVYYALHHLAQLQAGDKILIHGAAGGVGIAAVQYAQHCGAQVYATAGSDEKRDFLRLMGVQHIYDSRTLAYADQILADSADSQGQGGVDIVLNSLAGEAINRNLRVLKPFGRFLELGKRDFYENTHIGLRPFRNNISYFGIDADQLMRARPDLTRRLFAELMQLFAQGALHPLPYTAFDANDVIAAFRHMQQARQIGKIVVTYRHPIAQMHEPDHAAPTPGLRLPAAASYLVTGGLGGFGLRTAQWLAEKGARNLVLVSRSGVRADAAGDTARAAIAALQAQGVHVFAAACDVTDRAALACLLQDVATTMPPMKGIVHAAAVIADGLAANATPAQIAQNLAAKVLGAQHLHELTLGMALDFCIYYSSATTLFGNPGQSAYVAANVWLERLAQARRAANLPATCVRWGAIDDVGFLARNDKIKQALQTRMGGAALDSALALQALEDMLRADASDLAVLELDWRALARFLPQATAPKFADVARWAGEDTTDAVGADDIAQLLATLDDEELHARVVDWLKVELAEILRIAVSKMDAEQPIHDMGMDSLMGMELVVALETRFGVRVPVMALNDSVTINRLARQLVQMLRGDVSQDDAVTETVAHLAASHAADVSQASVTEFAAQMQRDTAPNRLLP